MIASCLTRGQGQSTQMKKDVPKLGVKIHAYIHPFYWTGFFMAKIGEWLYVKGVKIMMKYNVQIKVL